MYRHRHRGAVQVQPLDMIKTRQQTVSRGEPFLKVATDMVTSDQFGSVLLAAASEAVGYACYGLVIYPSFELGKLWLAGQIGVNRVGGGGAGGGG